jgi:hypothetical protein
MEDFSKRIDMAHSWFSCNNATEHPTHERLGLKHRTYLQAAGEPCYICWLLTLAEEQHARIVDLENTNKELRNHMLDEAVRICEATYGSSNSAMDCAAKISSLKYLNQR